MKKHFFALLFCILAVSFSFGQNKNEVPGIKNLVAWTSMPMSALKAELLKFKFTFSEERKDYWTKHISYIYSRQIPQGDSLVTERVIVKPADDGGASIEIFVLSDIVALYSTQIAGDNFKKTDCTSESTDNEKQSCYSNGICFLVVSESTRPSANGKPAVSYSAFIHRKKNN